MKIKTKKQFTLPQLIEWTWENPKRHETRGFIDDTREFDSEIYVQEHNGFISIQGEFNKDDTFTVTTEEEITEDTEFKSLVEVTTEGLFAYWEHTSINTWKDVHSKEFHAYIDGEFKCVWRDGKMVD